MIPDERTRDERALDAVARLFGPERCPQCGEARTPTTLKLRGGGTPTVQCKCDHPWSRK